MALLMCFPHATAKLFARFQVPNFAFLKNCFQTIRSGEKAHSNLPWHAEPECSPNATQMQPKRDPKRRTLQKEAVCSGLENRMSIFDSFHGTLELVCWKSGIWPASCQVVGAAAGSGCAWLGGMGRMGWAL